MKKPPLGISGSPLAILLLGTLSLLPMQMPVAGSTFTPPRSGAPGNREAGAARSDTCASTASSRGLTALSPTSNLGLTTKAFPTFFAYIPPNNAQKAEFRLIEEDTDQIVFTGELQLPGADATQASYKHKASVVSLSLPKQHLTEGLKVGKSYLWALMMVCDTKNRAADIVITGVVRRVGDDYFKQLDPDTKQKLSRVNSFALEEKISIYGSAGLWQDMLADAAALMQKNPLAYSSKWQSLLSEQGLEAIAAIPVIESNLEPIQP